MTARLVPDAVLPPYTFVPGQRPHPTSDPLGHSYGVPEPDAAPLKPDAWRASRPYLLGIDLFNAGYYWESHVAWESLWLACGRKGPTADFLKGLIQLAAAGVKALEGVPAGAATHSGRAAELWRSLPHDHYLGMDLAALVATAEAIRRNGWPSVPPTLVVSYD